MRSFFKHKLVGAGEETSLRSCFLACSMQASAPARHSQTHARFTCFEFAPTLLQPNKKRLLWRRSLFGAPLATKVKRYFLENYKK